MTIIYLVAIHSFPLSFIWQVLIEYLFLPGTFRVAEEMAVKKQTKDAEEFLQMSELRRSLASSSPQLAKFSLKGQIVIITFLF